MLLKDALKELNVEMEVMVEASARKNDQSVRKLLKDALKEINVKMEKMVEANAKKDQALHKLTTVPW
jgi:hypothetical protein